MKSKLGFRDRSDEAVRVKTGKGWKQWLSILDKYNVNAKGHTAATEYLCVRYKLDPWWCQALVIHYEWERGLRSKVQNKRFAALSLSEKMRVVERWKETLRKLRRAVIVDG